MEGGDHFPQKGVPSLGVVQLAGVVEDPSGGVGDHDTVHPGDAQFGQVCLHAVGGEGLGACQRRGDDVGLAAEGVLLGLEHQTLGDEHRVGIEEDGQGDDDGAVAEGEPGLEGAGRPYQTADRTPVGQPFEPAGLIHF